MKKILITGFSGFVGSHFLDYLETIEEQSIVLGMDIQAPLFPMDHFHHIKCDFDTLDLLDRAKVAHIIYQFQPDYILHLASYSSVGYSWINPIGSFQNNINIFMNILEAVRLKNIKTRILSVGSSEEYGIVEQDQLPLRENHPLKPTSPYAVARVSQELLSKVYVDSYGFDIVLTRSFNHIGPRQKDIFVIPSFAKQFVEGWKREQDIVRVVTGNLEIVRDFLDVRDVVRAYYALLKKGMSGEIYNVCSGRGKSLKEILSLMADKLHVKYESYIDKTLIRPTENSVVVGSGKKIEQQTGWNPEFAFEDTIGDILNDWKARLR